MISISQTEFIDIAKEITNGRPLWGLLRANEFFKAEDFTLKALQLKADKVLSSSPDYQGKEQLVSAIKAGKRLSELPEKLREQLNPGLEPGYISRGRYRYLPNHKRRTAERIYALKQVLGA